MSLLTLVLATNVLLIWNSWFNTNVHHTITTPYFSSLPLLQCKITVLIFLLLADFTMHTSYWLVECFSVNIIKSEGFNHPLCLKPCVVTIIKDLNIGDNTIDMSYFVLL